MQLFILHLSAALMCVLAFGHAIQGNDLGCAITLGCAAATLGLSMIWETRK